MNEIISKLKLLNQETLGNLRNSKAKNTVRAYKSDFEDFVKFCIKYNFSYLPSKPNIVSLYLTDLSKKYKISTLRRRLVSISVAHKLKGYYIDVKNPIILENLTGIKRKIGNFQKGKKPLLTNHLKSIINLIDQKKGQEIKNLRDKSIILVGFGGGFRRSEIVSLDYEDLEFVPEGLKITLKKSKTDQFGLGMVKGLPFFNNKAYCPVLSIKKWLEISKIKTGPIFRSFSKNLLLSNNRLSDQSIALIIKKYLNMIEMDSKNYSGHSLRSGFATASAEAGADERSIMNMTGHKSSQMVRRYIKEANLFKNNALNKLNL